ncbi:MAG: CHAD domain-containing protein [Acidobacteriia bacterium]|nr:CHAD domain-containing protein [Terriglobia bacterium]
MFILDGSVLPSPMSPLEKTARKLRKDFRSCVARMDDGRDLSARNVHRLRATIRRVEALVGFTQPDLTGKRRQTLLDLDSLRKRAGKVRDLDVQMGLLGALASGSAGADRRALLQALSHRRQRQVSRLIAALGKVNKQKFFARVERLTENARSNTASVTAGPVKAFPVNHGPLESAVGGVRQLARRQTGDKTLKPRKLHQVRIALKKLRYVAELAADSPQQQRFLGELKPVQKAIGEWHDWESLARAAEKHFSDRINCPLLVEIHALFAASYSAATAAVSHYLNAYRLIEPAAVPPAKPPKSAPSASALARTA